MATERVAQAQGDNESLWRKSTAFKIGVGAAVVGSIISWPVVVTGLSIAAGSAAWHHEKNPLKGKK